MQRQPMVSVLIPTYNQEQYIAHAIESVIGQRVAFDVEILVGDDASRDNTAEIVIGFQKRFPETVKGFFAQSNQGLVRNIHNLLNEAKGKYMALLGGDDFFSCPDKLTKQVGFLEAHPDYGAVHSDADFIFHNKNGRDRLDRRMHLLKKYTIPEGDIFESIILNNFVCASTSCFRSDAYNRFVDYDAFIKQGFMMEDLPMWLELSRWTKFGYIPESLATIRVVENSVARPKEYRKQYIFGTNAFSVCEYFIAKYGCSLETKEKLACKISEYNLIYAFLMRNKSLAAKEYSHLSKSDDYNSKKVAGLYYLGSQNIFMWFIVKVYLKLMKWMEIRERDR